MKKALIGMAVAAALAAPPVLAYTMQPKTTVAEKVLKHEVKKEVKKSVEKNLKKVKPVKKPVPQKTEENWRWNP